MVDMLNIGRATDAQLFIIYRALISVVLLLTTVFCFLIWLCEVRSDARGYANLSTKCSSVLTRKKHLHYMTLSHDMEEQ